MSFSQYVGDEFDSYCMRTPLIGYMSLMNACRQAILEKLRRLLVGLGWVSLQFSPPGGSVTTSCMMHVPKTSLSIRFEVTFSVMVVEPLIQCEARVNV